MGVTVIDPGRGAIAEGIASIGDALGKRLRFRKENEFRIASNLENLQGRAQAYRAAIAESEEAGAALLEAWKVTPDFANVLIASQPTVSERTDVETLRRDLPERGVELEDIETQVELEAAEAVLGSGLSALQVRAALASSRVSAEQDETFFKSGLIVTNSDNAVLQAGIDNRTLTELELSGIPEERVKLEGVEITLAQEVANAQLGLVRMRRVAGIDRLTVDRDVLALNAEQVGIADSAEFAAQYKTYIDGLDLTDPEQAHAHEVAIMGMNNVAALQHLQFHEQTDLTIRLRQSTLRETSEEEKLSNTLDFEDRIRAAVVFLGEASGRDEIGFATRQLNNLRLLASRMQIEGLLFPMDMAGATPRGGKYEFFFEDVASAEVAALLEDFGVALEADPGTTFPDPNAVPVTAQQLFDEMHVPGTGRDGVGSIWTDLTPKEQEEFVEKMGVISRLALGIRARRRSLITGEEIRELRQLRATSPDQMQRFIDQITVQ